MQTSDQKEEFENGKIKIGWAEVSITPDKKIALA